MLDGQGELAWVTG